MERKTIIDTSLQVMLERNELKTVKLLFDIFHEIYIKYGDITDNDIRRYNDSEDGQYIIKISISTIRNYLKQHQYIVKKDENCIVREMTVDEYADVITKIDALNKENAENTALDNNISVAEKLAMEYVSRMEKYKKQKQQSIRYAITVQDKFDKLCSDYPMFTKQYLLSLIISLGMDSIGYFPEENQ